MVQVTFVRFLSADFGSALLCAGTYDLTGAVFEWTALRSRRKQ